MPVCPELPRLILEMVACAIGNAKHGSTEVLTTSIISTSYDESQPTMIVVLANASSFDSKRMPISPSQASGVLHWV